MKLVPNAVSRRVARKLLEGQQHSPQMLFAAGVIGIGATVVFACRATLRVDSVLEHAEKELEKIDTTLEGTIQEVYSSKDAKADKAKVYIRLTVEIGRLYAPAIAFGVGSVIAFSSSNRILTRRNAALTAAYATLERAYSGYRERVREELGEDRERELYRDVREVEVTDANGKKKTVKQIDRSGSPYSFLFDNRSTSFSTTPEYNVIFLRASERYANDKLQAQGFLLLNDVLDAIGLERTSAGALVGWVKDSEIGDNYVDFGVFNRDRADDRFLDFVMGVENSVWLDFNVQGVVYDQISGRRYL